MQSFRVIQVKSIINQQNKSLNEKLKFVLGRVENIFEYGKNAL